MHHAVQTKENAKMSTSSIVLNYNNKALQKIQIKEKLNNWITDIY